MGIFSRVKFYFTIVVKNGFCELFVHPLQSGSTGDKKILKFQDKTELLESIKSALPSTKGGFGLFVCDFVEQDFEKELKDELFLVDKFDSYSALISKSEIISCEKKLGIKFDKYISAFCLLNELSKLRQSSAPTLYVLPFASRICLMLKENNKIVVAKMVPVGSEFMRCIGQDSDFDALNIAKLEDILFANLLYETKRFYATECSDFIEKIYIFNDELLCEGAGYLLYTKLLIKTELIPINLAQTICQMTIDKKIKPKKNHL